MLPSKHTNLHGCLPFGRSGDQRTGALKASLLGGPETPTGTEAPGGQESLGERIP